MQVCKLSQPRTNDPEVAAEVCDIIDVGQMLKCSARHVVRLVSEGIFPAPFRVGRLRRWSRKAILAWIDRQALAGDKR